jgi:hypothetical protein
VVSFYGNKSCYGKQQSSGGNESGAEVNSGADFVGAGEFVNEVVTEPENVGIGAATEDGAVVTGNARDAAIVGTGWMLAFNDESFLVIASGVIPSAARAVDGDGQPVKSNAKRAIATTA